MNRLKVWLYALLVVGAAGLSLYALTGELRARALGVLDGRLGAASARVAASQRALQAEVGAVAALAARDPALLRLLAGPEDGAPHARRAAREAEVGEAAAQAAARAAVSAAEEALGVTLPQGASFLAGDRSWLEARAADPAGEAEVVALLRGAAGGAPQRGVVRTKAGVAFAAAVPAGDGLLAVTVPLDAAWVAAVAAGSGVDVTLAAKGMAPLSSLRAGAAPLVQAAAAGSVRDAGRLGAVPVEVAGVPLGKRPLLLGAAPSHRVLALPLGQGKDVQAVLSAATEPLLAPVVRLQWAGVAGIAVALLLGLLFGLLVRPAEAPAQLPDDLLAAADRIGRGDFAARAPALAGKLGTLAAALNRAAAAAEPGAGPSAPPSLTQEFFPAPPAEPAPDVFQFPARGAAPEPLPPAAPLAAARAAEPLPPEPAPPPFAAPASPPTLRLDAPSLGGGAFQAAPVAPARPPPPVPGPATVSPAALLQSAAQAAPAAEPGDDEEHWREVFREFLRVRGECGESTQGLTYERFRAKLESNRASLVAKYGCRTVRFQVYVKEGKTALKATPVR